MNEPIKLIWKYKNNYNLYIFVGNINTKKTQTILEKITNYSLYDTLMNLSIDERIELTNVYGTKWFSYFFIKEHINATLKNKNLIDDLIKKKYDKDWIINNIKNYKTENVYYSFESFANNKLKKRKYKYIDDKNEIKFNDFKNLHGGDYDEFNEEENEFNGEENDEDINFDEENNEEINNEEINTVKLKDDIKFINNTIGNKILVNKNIEFKEKSSNRTELENLHEKVYVYDFYIYKDDTIENIKKVIVNALYNRFSNNKYLIPNEIYLWVRNGDENISLSHTWINNNEILKINNEPIIDDFMETNNKIKLLMFLLDKKTAITHENNSNKILYTFTKYMSVIYISLLSI